MIPVHLKKVRLPHAGVSAIQPLCSSAHRASHVSPLTYVQGPWHSHSHTIPRHVRLFHSAVVYPLATLDPAIRRISVLCQGVIFGDTGGEEKDDDGPEYNETLDEDGQR